MNYKFYQRIFAFFSIMVASFSLAIGQCSIENVEATQSDCNSGVFNVTINFTFDGVGNEGFRVQGNGVNYGNFSYADVPIQIGPLEGDGVTPYEFVVIDNQFNDCSDFTELGIVNCNSGDCEIYDLTLNPSDCDANGQYDLHINFLVNNPTHTFFDVNYAGATIGYFALADLPIVIDNFEDNGENSPPIQVCINDNNDCCAQGEFVAPNCNSGSCEISGLEVTNVECDGDLFYITLNFDYANVGGDGFTVQGNGMSHGTFNYDHVPVTIGPLPANNGTFWEFVVKDVNHPDCSDAIGYGQVNCGGGDCHIFDLVVETGDCNNAGTYPLTIDFGYTNPNNDFFNVYYKGENIGFFPLADLPLTIPHFEDNGETNQGILVCINDNPNCCEDIGFTSPCNSSNCHFSGFFAEAHPCNGDGLYQLDFEFNAENVGDDGFIVLANGTEYVPFNYGETFYTVGPLHDGVVYEIIIQDVQHPDCHYWNEWGPIYCDDGCHIYDLNAEVSDCDDQGQFYVTLDFGFTHTGDDGYKIIGNGNVYGFYNYDHVPVTLGPFVSGSSDVLEFLVKDVHNPDCGDAVEVHVPDCHGNNSDCSIRDLVADVTPCLGDGTFYVILDFIHENTSNIGFSVHGNGINYGLFSYDDLPISIGPLIGNGTTPYEFVVRDLNMFDCGEAIDIGPVDCEIMGDCQVTDLIAVPGSCYADGTFNLWLNFDFENVSNLYFDVYYNGQIIDYFPLSSLPVVIPHFESDDEPVQEITVCINDTPNCCATYSFANPGCMEPLVSWPGDADFSGQASHFDLLNIGLAYGENGPDRDVLGIEWVALSANNWDLYFNTGLNFKHADCNGDGEVNKEDIQAIEVNYGFTHGDAYPEIFIGGNEQDPPFYVDLSNDLDLTTGSEFFAPINLGNASKPVENLYGIAFTLVFDPEIIVPESIEMKYDPSWLGVADVNLLTFDKTHANLGRVDVALARSDQNDVSGFGQIAGFIGIIDNIAGKEAMKVEIENVRALNGKEALIPLHRPVEVIDLNVATEETQVGVFQIYPNPANDYLFLQHPDRLAIDKLNVYDTNGRQVWSGSLQNQQLDVSQLISGVYTLKIETQKGLYVERFVKF